MPRRFARNNSQMIEERKEIKSDSESDGNDFEEGDLRNDSDFEDQLLSESRRLKRRKREEDKVREAKKIIGSQYLPSSSKKLSACLSCKLLLNREKWRKLE